METDKIVNKTKSDPEDSDRPDRNVTSFVKYEQDIKT